MRETSRLLVVVAHPDDETFGCGSLLARARAAGVLVRDARAYVPHGLRITVGSEVENDRLLEAWS